MQFQGHYHFFKRGVTRPFANAVHGHFHLPRPVHNTGQRVGRCQTQIVMAVNRNHGLINVGHTIVDVFDLFAVLTRQAIARRIGNIDNRCPGLNNGFGQATQEIKVGATGIFGVKFNIINIIPGVFDRIDGLLQNGFTVTVELITNMNIRRTNTCMNPTAFG